MNDDLISRQWLMECVNEGWIKFDTEKDKNRFIHLVRDVAPSAQPTLYGYNIEHLELIARVLQKENLSPERVVEALTDIGRIVAIVSDEFEETLRKAVEECTKNM